MITSLNSSIRQVLDVFSECYATKFGILIVLLVEYDNSKKCSRVKGLNGYALLMNPNRGGPIKVHIYQQIHCNDVTHFSHP